MWKHFCLFFDKCLNIFPSRVATFLKYLARYKIPYYNWNNQTQCKQSAVLFCEQWQNVTKTEIETFVHSTMLTYTLFLFIVFYFKPASLHFLRIFVHSSRHVFLHFQNNSKTPPNQAIRIHIKPPRSWQNEMGELNLISFIRVLISASQGRQGGKRKKLFRLTSLFHSWQFCSGTLKINEKKQTQENKKLSCKYTTNNEALNSYICLLLFQNYE